MLSLLIIFPFLAALATFFAGEFARRIALGAAIAEFALSVFIALQFLPQGGLQFLNDYAWIPGLGIRFTVAMDGISLLLVLLTTFLTPLIILSSFQHKYQRPGLFYGLVLTMQMALVGVFVARDAFLFYIFWELALIPIYLICLLWGGKNRFSITLKFFIYTLTGSLLMLVAFIWLWLQTPGTHSFALNEFYALQLTAAQESLVFWAIFLAFAIKMPLFPFHTWQPDTYTDSPTSGTMLLSGIMLKMGVYGLLRWLLPLTPGAIEEWGFVVLSLAVSGIVYASLIAITQKDFKRLIAYSSIAHVGLIAAGIFSLNRQGMEGGVIQMLSHGVNVVGLFFIADIIFRRQGTHEMEQLGGIRNVAPAFSTVFMILILASIGLPLTNGFVGEFLLLNGLFQYHVWLAGLAGLTIILGAVYTLNAYKKVAHGEEKASTRNFADLQASEWAVVLPLMVVIFWIGIYPRYFLEIAGPSVETLLGIIREGSITAAK